MDPCIEKIIEYYTLRGQPEVKDWRWSQIATINIGGIITTVIFRTDELPGKEFRLLAEHRRIVAALGENPVGYLRGKVANYFQNWVYAISKLDPEEYGEDFTNVSYVTFFMPDSKTPYMNIPKGPGGYDVFLEMVSEALLMIGLSRNEAQEDTFEFQSSKEQELKQLLDSLGLRFNPTFTVH